MNTILVSLIICSVYSFIMYQILSIRINKKIDNKTFLNDVKKEINLLVVQINETSDRNVLLIENRLDRLSSVLAESDKKISSLRSATASAQKELSRKIKAPIAVEAEEPLNKSELQPKIEVGNSSGPVVSDDLKLSKNERILLLYKQGISPTVIASQTKATISEVEMIISLSRG